MLASVSLPRPRRALRADERDAVSDSNMATPEWRSRRVYRLENADFPPVTSRSNRERAHSVPLTRRVAGVNGASPEGVLENEVSGGGPSDRRRPPGSAEGARLAHHRRSGGHRHAAPPFAARRCRLAGRAACRLAGRGAHGGGSRTRCRSGTARPELHERRTAAAAAHAATAPRGGREARYRDHQTQRTGHE